MREIVYIQAGKVSNYIGTHFWNTQECYFTYDEEEDVLVNHDVSFREGLSWKGTSTYCPRLLLFDQKGNFGHLGKYNELYPDSSVGGQQGDTGISWQGSIVEHKQDPVQKSDYQLRLEEGEEEDVYDKNATKPSNKLDLENVTSERLNPRFWADYNRMFYIPRSIQMVPELASLGQEDSRNSWETGRLAFEHYNQEKSVIEDDLRVFLEESDNLQGFHVQFDNSSFGGFTSSLLEVLRDDLPKIPILALPILSADGTNSVDGIENSVTRQSILQGALCLRALNDLVTQCIPLQQPTTWKSGPWSSLVDLDTSSLYETSAILSAHIENVTLPLRLKHKEDDLFGFCQHLNWSQSTKFSQLSGILPYLKSDPTEFQEKDFSSFLDGIDARSSRMYSLRNVSRGLSLPQMKSMEAKFSTSGLDSPYLTSSYAPAYPLPSSYPRYLFSNIGDSGSLRGTTSNLKSGLNRTTMTSSLRTSSSTALLLSAHAQFAEKCAKRRVDVGMDLDYVRELANDLWTIHDGYTADERRSDDELGEDEET